MSNSSWFLRMSIWKTTTTLHQRCQTLFLRLKPYLQNHFWMSWKLKSSLVRIFDTSKNSCLSYWTCTKSVLHLRLLNVTLACLQNKLMIGPMQIRYVVIPYSVCYLIICLMSITLTRKQRYLGFSYSQIHYWRRH